jgi:DNA-binding PadR family transcriptional regulator
MPLHHAVLALLAGKSAHGYQLRTSFEQAVGDQWGGLNIGHLYQILDRLARDGLIQTQRQHQPVRPDRLVHRLTPAGRAELDRWLSQPSIRPRGYRDDFFLKLMAATQLGDPALLAGVLNRQRLHLLRELRSLTEATARASTSPVDALLLTAAKLHVQADLEIVDAAETALEQGQLIPQPAAAPAAASAPPAAHAQPANAQATTVLARRDPGSRAGAPARSL